MAPNILRTPQSSLWPPSSSPFTPFTKSYIVAESLHQCSRATSALLLARLYWKFYEPAEPNSSVLAHLEPEKDAFTMTSTTAHNDFTAFSKYLNKIKQCISTTVHLRALRCVLHPQINPSSPSRRPIDASKAQSLAVYQRIDSVNLV